MYDWYENGKIVGAELADKAPGSIVSVPTEDLAFSETQAWINGVLDGVEGNAKRIKGIRVSHALLARMATIKDAELNDHYRGYPFVGAERLWPQDRVEIEI